MPVVSVIVPNFNHSKYLGKRIDSILNQTYKDFELILMDDCSTDNSREILEQYKSNPKVSHIIFNEENSGNTFKQWEKGISYAKGKYIWIAESDDWCEANLLETLIDGINKDPDCVISYCQSYCITDDSHIIFQSNHSELSEIMDGTDFIKKHLAVPVAIFNASMVLWQKDKFQYVPKELTSYRFCGDWYFWIQLSRFGKVHISAKLLNYFRKHDNDVSGKAYKSGLNFIEELKIINMMFTEKLISEDAYYRAYKDKFMRYWLVRNRIDSTNKVLIQQLFNNALSSKINLLKLVPSAIWKSIKK